MSNTIALYEFNAGLPFEFEIIQFKDMYRLSRSKLIVPHRTDFYHILWFKNKNRAHLVDFQQVPIQSNSLLFLGKNKIHQFDDCDEQEGLAVIFTDDFFCKTAEHSKLLHSTPLFNDFLSVSELQLLEKNDALTTVLNTIETELKHPIDNAQPDILRNLVHNLLLLSERQYRAQNHIELKKNVDLDYVMLFKKLLEDHYTVEKRVNHYASTMRITEKRLNQATSKTLGNSPKQLIDQRVILEAKRLLIYTNDSAKEIGFKLGFEEPTNFIKYFKKHCQQTPADFRTYFARD